jgi:hypothetical protein
MSRIVWVKNLEDGALVNALSVTLGDPGTTYGIKETLTGTVVVPAGTATVNIEIGKYTYDISNLDPILAYDASFKVVHTYGEVDYAVRHIPQLPAHPPGPEPKMCLVYGTLKNTDGTPAANVDVELVVDRKNLPEFAQHYVLSGNESNFSTDDTGYFEIQMIQKSLVTLHAKGSNLKCEIAVPEVDEIAIEQIIGQYGTIKPVENPF